MLTSVSLSLICHFYVYPAEETEKKPPINIKFEIPYFTVSGIQVRYLKIVEKSGYQALPWVRYITQNGGKLILSIVVQPSHANTKPCNIYRLPDENARKHQGK